jgi:branched-chain amino acid transport system substrate-binding protein
MISPANTYTGLTRDGPGTEGYGPARFYPDGVCNYVRLAPPDDAQGSAGALVARDGVLAVSSR